MTISDLSAEISLSMPAISERLKKLEASGVIKQYTVILDPAMLNKHLMALMYVQLENPTHGDSFASFVKDEVEIKDQETPKSNFDSLEEEKANMNWWWLLVIAAFGAAGWAMYRKYQQNKEKQLSANSTKENDK